MQQKKQTELTSCRELDLKKTFECGQCFRWREDADGIWHGIAMGREVSAWYDGGKVFISADRDETETIWRTYFDLDTDYAVLRSHFPDSEYLRRCCEFGTGIRILRQAAWETLCTFILSQCNNIPRIKNIVERLCALCGDILPGGGYAFPGAAQVAALDDEAVERLRCGYRAAYVRAAAEAVAGGHLDLDALCMVSGNEARTAVKALPGVGDKIADCFLLFGLHNMEAFPVDVWMKRALHAHFPPDFDPVRLGEGAGLAQQYIFYYARCAGNLLVDTAVRG